MFWEICEIKMEENKIKTRNFIDNRGIEKRNEISTQKPYTP